MGEEKKTISVWPMTKRQKRKETERLQRLWENALPGLPGVLTHYLPVDPVVDLVLRLCDDVSRRCDGVSGADASQICRVCEDPYHRDCVSNDALVHDWCDHCQDTTCTRCEEGLDDHYNCHFLVDLVFSI
jgi:hypothetical protein